MRKLLGLLVCGGMLLGPWTTTAFAAEVTVENSNQAVTWSDNTYVVNGDVTIKNLITVGGDVTLRLEEGAKLTVRPGGIRVDTGNSLTIEGTGTLDIQGSSGNAGIGGENGSACGTVRIKGGTVKARGGTNSAGIGGGGTSTLGGSGGTVIITGGTVEATGGSSGAGIGGGNKGQGGTVQISGGMVTAKGGACGAGIGGGEGGNGGAVTISGGIVIAEKGSGSVSNEAIGYGMGGSNSGTRTITQGIIKEGTGSSAAVSGSVTLDEEELSFFSSHYVHTITVPSGASLTLRTATGEYHDSPITITAEAGGVFTVVKKGESGEDPTPGGSTSGGSTSPSSAASDQEPALPETANPVNEKGSQEALGAGQSLSFRLYNDLAAISRETADILGMSQGTLTIINDRMTVIIPGGYGLVTEKGRVHYPMNFISDPAYGSTMRAAVKGEDARTETVKAGGSMTMPGTVTVTLRTKLTGTVNVYHFDEGDDRYTKLATTAVKNGEVTFSTRRMGNMVITTGTI